MARGPDLAPRGLADICRRALAQPRLPLAAGKSRFPLSTCDGIESMYKNEPRLLCLSFKFSVGYNSVHHCTVIRRLLSLPSMLCLRLVGGGCGRTNLNRATLETALIAVFYCLFPGCRRIVVVFLSGCRITFICLSVCLSVSTITR